MDLTLKNDGRTVDIRVDNDDERFMLNSAFPTFSRRNLAAVTDWSSNFRPVEYPYTTELPTRDLFTVAGGIYNEHLLFTEGAGMSEEYRQASKTLLQFLGNLPLSKEH